MKNLLKLTSMLFLVVLSSCEDYGDDFNKLNERIDSLENQIAGFADLNQGINDLDAKVDALSDILDGLPQNSQFESGISGLQSEINDLQEALADLISGNANAIGDLNASLQDQVDTLNEMLASLKADLKLLLDANNVFPGDLIILDEGSLEAALAFVKNRDNLIIDGALVIDADWADGIQSGAFDAAKVNQLTSKIVAVLGHRLTVSYSEGDQVGVIDGFINGYFNAIDDNGDYGAIEGDLKAYFTGWLDGVNGDIGTLMWAGEIDSVDGDLDLSKLQSVSGYFEVDEIQGNVDLSGLERHTNGSLAYFNGENDLIGRDTDNLNYAQDRIDEEIFEEGGHYGNDFKKESLAFSYIEGDINLSSLIYSYDLDFKDVSGAVDLSSLVSVYEDLNTDLIGGLTAPLLKTVGDDLRLDYGGGYVFASLKYIGDDFSMVDYGTENENGAVTSIIDFRSLRAVGSRIRVYNEEYEADLDNEFSNATYVNILGYFSSDYDWDGTENGFGAPLATTVIVNGDTYYEDNVSDIYDDLFLYAPLADVTLTFTHVDGYLGVNFKTLTAASLEYVDVEISLYGPLDEEGAPLAATIVSFPELTGIDDGDINTAGVYELLLPKYDEEEERIEITSNDLVKLTIKNVRANSLDFESLESLTITALDGTSFNFSKTFGDFEDTLTTVNITGASICDAYVYIGTFDGTNKVNTSFSALETLTLSGSFNEVQVVGAEGLKTINFSGNFISNDIISNDAVTSDTRTWTPGDNSDCDPI
jgi:hypothetical protein